MIPPLHLVTDGPTLARGGFLSMAAEALEAGGRAVALHLRGREVAGRRLLALLDRLLPIARSTGGLLLVNDRVDVALVGGADGVHLPEKGVPVREARALLPAEAIVGRSVHGPAELAPGDRPDFLLVGTIFSTPSHPGRPGAGVDRLREVEPSADGLPLIAIGGVTAERVPEVLGAGAHGIAMMRAIWEAERPARAVSEVLAAIGAVRPPPLDRNLDTKE